MRKDRVMLMERCGDAGVLASEDEYNVVRCTNLRGVQEHPRRIALRRRTIYGTIQICGHYPSLRNTASTILVDQRYVPATSHLADPL